METTIVYWGNLGIMEKKMEATIMGFGKSFFPFWGVLTSLRKSAMFKRGSSLAGGYRGS